MDTDPDPDPAIFVSDLKTVPVFPKFFCLLLFEATVASFSKIKSHKTVGIRLFFLRYYFCLMIGGFGAGSPDPEPYFILMGPDPGGPKKSGSGSRS